MISLKLMLKGGILGQRLLEALGCEVVIYGAEPHGKFAHPPEPTAVNLEEIAARVKELDCCIGFCQDPDAEDAAPTGAGQAVEPCHARAERAPVADEPQDAVPAHNDVGERGRLAPEAAHEEVPADQLQRRRHADAGEHGPVPARPAHGEGV